MGGQFPPHLQTAIAGGEGGKLDADKSRVAGQQGAEDRNVLLCGPHIGQLSGPDALEPRDRAENYQGQK